MTKIQQQASQQIKQQVADIAALDGDKNKIDSQKELHMIGDLLSGKTLADDDADTQYLRQKYNEGRENLQKQREDRAGDRAKNLSYKVSQFVQDFVKKVASLEGDKRKIDGDEEVKIIQNYIKENENNLSESEIKYLESKLVEGGQAPKKPQVILKQKDYSIDK